MLASVLHSDTAITATIQIMDAFVEMRHILPKNGGLVNRLSNVESKMLEQDARLLEHDHVLLPERRFHTGGSAEEVGRKTD